MKSGERYLIQSVCQCPTPGSESAGSQGARNSTQDSQVGGGEPLLEPSPAPPQLAQHRKLALRGEPGFQPGTLRWGMGVLGLSRQVSPQWHILSRHTGSGVGVGFHILVVQQAKDCCLTQIRRKFWLKKKKVPQE